MTYKQQSILYSFLFHLIVLGLFYSIHFQTAAPPVQQLIEFIMFEPIEPIAISQPATTRPQAATEGMMGDIPHQEATVHQTDIDLPNVTFPELDPVDISSLPERADRVVVGNVHGTALRDTLMRATIPTANVFDTPQGVVTNPFGDGSSVGIEGFADEIKLQTGSISHLLQGEVRNRTIITNVLPEFPENIMRNASVTMEFTVVENGSVQNVRITRRSEPEFERVSVEALSQWIFNRDNRVHTGQITFNFILE